MKDYYLLVGLNSKEVKITKVNQNEKGVVEIEIENKSKKVRCPKCNKLFEQWFNKFIEPFDLFQYDEKSDISINLDYENYWYDWLEEKKLEHGRYGDRNCSDENNMFDDKAYRCAKYFQSEDYNSATDYAVNVIKKNFPKELNQSYNYRFSCNKSLYDLDRIISDAKDLEYEDYEELATFEENDMFCEASLFKVFRRRTHWI